jgi:hypothetical protein
MLEWEITLESLRRKGWGYGYGKFSDPTTGGAIYLVNLGRENKRLSIIKPTIEEAVIAISSLAHETS